MSSSTQLSDTNKSPAPGRTMKIALTAWFDRYTLKLSDEEVIALGTMNSEELTRFIVDSHDRLKIPWGRYTPIWSRVHSAFCIYEVIGVQQNSHGMTPEPEDKNLLSHASSFDTRVEFRSEHPIQEGKYSTPQGEGTDILGRIHTRLDEYGGVVYVFNASNMPTVLGSADMLEEIRAGNQVPDKPFDGNVNVSVSGSVDLVWYLPVILLGALVVASCIHMFSVHVN
jgi:hypothetical protein